MFNQLNVLYLEDEPLVAFDTGEHLESLGFDDVTVAYKLRKAELAASQTNYDAAILDINVDGGQTSIALGQALLAKGTAVLFASGYGSEEKRLREMGFEFLCKPFSLPQLTKKLEDMLFQDNYIPEQRAAHG